MPRVRKIVLAAMLLAVMIVLERFISIKTPVIRISFGFIPLMFAGIWLGPKYCMLIGGLADLIGAVCFPNGAYFPGYTLSAIMSGFIYGFCLYKKSDDKFSNKNFIFRLIISSLLVLIIINAGLNTIWIYITTKTAVTVFAPLRILKQLVMLPIQVLSIYFLELAVRNIFNKYVRDCDD